jgi:selenocysteine lyase/cysteine desulfurase
VTTPLPRDQFPVAERYRYFDHAGVAPIPQVAADAAWWWADRMLRQGKVDYDELEERQETTRAAAAALMGVPAVDVAFIKNTTEGLAFVAAGLDWAPGDRVVVPDLEFPSTLYPWLALTDRGVKVDLVTPVGTGGTLPLAEFERVLAAGPPPKVVAVSWVQYSRGWRTDLAALAHMSHDAGALFCADVIQGLGVVPAALEAWGVDFAMADGHKWLLGPEGIGVFYVAERVRDRLRPVEPGWASMLHRAEWENLELVWDDSARRFEGGTSNMVGTMALGASLQLLLDAGVANVWDHVDRLCDRLVGGLGAIDGVRVLTDRTGDGRSGIVTFAVDGIAPDDLAERLTADRFVCAPRGGGVRIAPHGYNTAEEIDALVGAAGDQQDRQSEGHRTA